MKRYTLHELLHLTFTGEERLCLASEVDAKIEELASCGVECSEGFKRMQARIAELEHELDIRKAAVEAQFRLMKTVEELRVALADIAFSEDLTLKGVRSKAKRIYEKTGL